MPRGLKKLTHAASTQAAWQDWHTLQTWCVQNGQSEVANRRAPAEGAGWKTVDRSIAALRADLGAPSGPWGRNVLEGLNPQQQPLPPGVPAIVEEALATGNLVKANEELHRLSGGKTIQQVAADWAGQIQPPAGPEQRGPDQTREKRRDYRPEQPAG
jgi:hypothetical protein